MIGRADYNEHKAERIEYYTDKAAAARAESESACKMSHDMAAAIPMGQPILVGHYSAKRDIAYRDKIAASMDKAVKADEKSDYYADKAAAAANNHAISSDDPEAVEKLQAKIKALEAEREKVKAANKAARAAGKEPAPWYVLPYIGKDIKRLQDRIKKLQAVDEMPHQELEFCGGKIITNEEINRVQILFDEKPDESTRNTLKAYGFRWSPREMAWQAIRNPASLRRAQQAVGRE